MDQASAERGTSHAGPVLLFDGVCNLCDASVRWLIRHDRRREFRFAPLQSRAGAALLRDARATGRGLDSVVLVEGHRVWTRSDAALEVLRRLGPPWSVVGVARLLPNRLRDALYDALARRRYAWFGRRDTCALPTPELAERFLEEPPSAS